MVNFAPLVGEESGRRREHQLHRFYGVAPGAAAVFVDDFGDDLTHVSVVSDEGAILLFPFWVRVESFSRAVVVVAAGSDASALLLGHAGNGIHTHGGSPSA